MLVLCVRIDRAAKAGSLEAAPWQEEIHQTFEQEIKVHFAAEEAIVFPRAARFAELKPLVEELLGEHAALRERFARAEARAMNAEDIAAFAEALALHIRKEERQLFEGMQKLMGPQELREMGVKLAEAQVDFPRACSM
jgi:hemerythrin-like domain-containing protein